jgi:hypothetical protein
MGDKHDGGVSRAAGIVEAPEMKEADADTGLARGHMPVE